MSKSSILDKKVKKYILAAIYNGGYEDTAYFLDLKSDIHRAIFITNVFKAEYGWMIARMGPQEAVKNWLQGLPSSIHIVFNNCDILDLAHKWGSLPKNATARQEDKNLENYWLFMANKLLQIMNKSGARL